jgi:hypothetical protein
MRFQLPDGQIVRIDTPFTLNEIQYPSNWLRLMTPADRAAFGAIELPEPEPFDERWYVAPGVPKPLEQIKQRKLSDLAAYRYGKETAGVGGFRTDRESQSLITGAALAATLDPAYTVDWKSADGWVTLNATQLLAAAQSVRAHVQACFSNEKAHAAAIEALAEVQAAIDYDYMTGWP